VIQGRFIFSAAVATFFAITLVSCLGAQSAAQKPAGFDDRVEKLKEEYKHSRKLDANGKPMINPFTTQGLSPLKVDSDATKDTPKKLSIPTVGASESIFDDNIHDPENNAVNTLQNPVVALKEFPRDRRQQVDWVQALDKGFIEPRADIKGETKIQELDLDIIMKNTQFMPWVRFPHIVHTRWLACSNCHPKIFIPKENANPISMNKVLRGQYCGVCHDKVAFALFICERCHSVPHPGSGPKWWK